MSQLPQSSAVLEESSSALSAQSTITDKKAADKKTIATKSDYIKKAIGILVSAVAIAILAFSVEWSKVGVALTQMHYWVVIPSVILIAVQMVLRGLRWGYLLPKTDTEVRARVLVDAIMVGNLASSILPLRAGEFVRPLLLSFQTKHSFPTAFVSVIIERFFDLSAVLISFGMVALIVNDIPPLMVKGALVLSLLAAALLLFIVVGALLPRLVKDCTSYVFSYLPEGLAGSLQRFVINLLGGAASLRSPINLAKVIVYSTLIWLTTFFSYYVFFWLFDIPATMTQAVVTTVFVALAVAAPSAPGFVGVYQLGCIAALSLFSIDLEVATAYALISHLIQYATSVMYGGYALSCTEWKLSDLLKRAPVES
jgi:uncharacterized protein (TIRG00374 family)